MVKNEDNHTDDDDDNGADDDYTHTSLLRLMASANKIQLSQMRFQPCQTS